MSAFPRFRAASALAAPLVALFALAGCGAGGLGDLTGSSTTTPPPSGTTSPPSPTTTQEEAYAQEVLDLVNVERTSRGLLPVVSEQARADTAYDHAYDMDARNFFDHVNPDGEDPGARLVRHGVTWFTYGENIAMGQQTP